MSHEAPPESWRRLMELLAGVHEQAAATARRLSRGPAEGDDLYQEAVLRAHQKLSSLRDESRFRAWFYAVLLSIHRNRTRAGFWRRFLSLEDPAMGTWEPAGHDGIRRETERHQAERASRALATLPPEQREAVVLFELEGFSIEEIAALQKATVPAVKSRLTRGRARLRIHYERLGLKPREDARPATGPLPVSEGRRS